MEAHMAQKVLLAGMVGGIVAFIVMFLLHMVTSLGDAGVKNLPGDKILLPAMRANIHDPGFYFFPPMQATAGMTADQAKSVADLFAADFKMGPTGILIYRPGGDAFDFGRLISVQFVINLLAAFMIAVVLAMTVDATTYGKRVLIVLLIGIFASVSVDLPYWNWYGFPPLYTAARILSDALTWLVVGLVMAAIVRRPRTAQIA
jgi:hypothetical protein